MMVKCPTCKKLHEYDMNSPWRPFCSERCKLIDLGAWASGDYVIRGEPGSADPGLDRRAARKDAKRAGRKRTQEEVENLLGISSKNSTDRTRKSQRTVRFVLPRLRRQARLRPSSSKTCEGLSLFLQGLPACRCCRLGRRRPQFACRREICVSMMARACSSPRWRS